MALTRKITFSSNLGGQNLSASLNRAGESEVNADAALVAAQSGTLTTRSDPDTGVLTMAATTHGLAAAAVVDVFWEGGSRHGVIVGAVVGTAGPIDGGAGDQLPAVNTPVLVATPKTLDVDFTAAAVKLALATSVGRCVVKFQKDDDTLIFAVDLGKDEAAGAAAGGAWEWHSGGPDANPFTADVGKIVVSSGVGPGGVANRFRFGALLG